MNQIVIFSPTDFIAVLNQTLEFAYPSVTIEGELAELRISKNRWVYFNLKDEFSSVAFFGSVYQLPGPLQNGLRVRVVGSPRLHARYGFSVSFQSISPVGEGSIKKAADLLRAKLEVEGLFAPERKRLLPSVPQSIGLITAAASAACADFMKTLNERWGGVEVWLIDSLVQGDQAPSQLVKAIEHMNKLPALPEVLVITRGGGSAEDLAAFNDERVVRAIAASRIPTLVAIGHEVDVSLAELVADLRASTPTAAASIVVPDRRQILAELKMQSVSLAQSTHQVIRDVLTGLAQNKQLLIQQFRYLLDSETQRLADLRRIIMAFNPENILRRGYALVVKNSRYITSTKSVAIGERLQVVLRDGKIITKVKSIDAQN